MVITPDCGSGDPGSIPSTYPRNIRCHEAILIYTLVEVDAERQIIEKTEFLSEKTRVVKIDDDTPIRAKTVSILLSLDKAAVVMELDEQPYLLSADSMVAQPL